MQHAQKLVEAHISDPNIAHGTIDRLSAFLQNDALLRSPDDHRKEIDEAKIEVSLLTGNSPYAEVRAVVDPHDNPNLPCGTIRAWIIGLFFVVVIAFINQLFSVRQPTIFVQAPVVQLLSYPVGKFAERVLPDIGFTLFGVRHSLNPGPFNKKEHMLISIMASVGKTLPSSRYISAYPLPGPYRQLLTVNSLHRMARQVFWTVLRKVFWVPDFACYIYQSHGVWPCWSL